MIAINRSANGSSALRFLASPIENNKFRHKQITKNCYLTGDNSLEKQHKQKNNLKKPVFIEVFIIFKVLKLLARCL